MRARYYSVELMRFINEDIVLGDIGNSNSLNRYTYVEGNPATMVDPFGLCAKKVMNLFDAGLDAVKGRLHKIISLGDIKNLDAEQLRKLASFVQSVSDAMDMLSQAFKDAAKKDATLAADATIVTATVAVTSVAVLSVTGAGEIIVVGEVVIGGGIALSLWTTSIFNLASSISLNLMSSNLKDLSDSLNKSADNKTSNSPTSQNQMQKQVERGKAPKSVDRVDKPHVEGQQPHIHFGENEAALNIDGTWHDEGMKSIPKLDKKTIKWIIENGWKLPNE